MKKKGKRAASKAKNNNLKISLPLLRWLNLAAAGLLAIQGAAILLMSSPVNGLLPVTTNHLTAAKLAPEGDSPLVQATRHLFDVNLAIIVAVFLIISALAYLLMGTLYRPRYEAELKEGVNRARWVHYSLSASLMLAAVALLAGVSDFASLLMIIALGVIMCFSGLAMEQRGNNGGAAWLNYWLGVAAGLIPWLVVLIYVWGSSLYGSSLPAYLYWLFGTVFLGFVAFALNMLLRYKNFGSWSDYLYAERNFILLSVLVKSALAWQIFAGTLRP